MLKLTLSVEQSSSFRETADFVELIHVPAEEHRLLQHLAGLVEGPHLLVAVASLRDGVERAVIGLGHLKIYSES